MTYIRMINTLSELLKEFIDAERAALDKHDIKHRPTIGEMYEGLTEQLVHKSIFSGLNLTVSTQSFIEGCDTEFDVILSEGEGEQIPHTLSYRYKAKQVIAVIQVKKTLTSQELSKSYDNLKPVAKVFLENITDMDASLLRDAFKSICHKDIAAYRKGLLNLQEEYIYHTLVMDSFLPLRIVLGYNGYKTEEGLRNAFLNFLEDNISTKEKKIYGFSPMVFPNLIISEGVSLIKLTGCPYSATLGHIAEEWWEVMGSTHFNPMHIFLEMLWTKLSYRFHKLPVEIFGEDLETEPIVQFLRSKVHLDIEGHPIGWDYEFSDYKEKELAQQNNLQEWQPAIIDRVQMIVLQGLGKHHIDITQDKDLESFVIEGGYTSLKDFISTLENLRLVTLEGNTLKLLTRELVCVYSLDGNIYAADNSDGRLSRWICRNNIRKKMKIQQNNG